MQDFKAFADKIGVTFEDLGLLVEAMTHRSFINEHKEAGSHNERLEFLGDAVLELAATDFLFKRFPGADEGELTSYRAAIVNTVSLAESARALGLNDFMRLSRGEARDTGRARDIILADAFEAVIGAIYLDRGYAAAESFIARTILNKIDRVIAEKTYQDAKSRFQELAQERFGVTPHYKTLAEEGPDHARIFTVAVYVEGAEIAKGKGRSKQEAEQAAAEAALDTPAR